MEKSDKNKKKLPLNKIFLCIEYISAFAARISYFILFIMAFLIFYEVIARYIFSNPTGFADEISSYMLAAIVFLANGQVLKEDGHVSVTLLVAKFSNKVQQPLKIVTNTFSLIFFLTLTLLCTSMVTEHYHTGARTYYTTLQLPLYWLQIILPIGFALLAIQMISKIFHQLRPDRFRSE